MAEFNPIEHDVYLLQYVWLAADQSLRSKTRTYYQSINSIDDIPKWNYDGSSCGQAPGATSEIILVPCALFRDPFRKNLPYKHIQSFLVLCKSETVDGTPALGCNREYAEILFKNRMHEKPPKVSL